MFVYLSCGHERSVWDIGGIRDMAFGNPRWWMRCPRCGGLTWDTVVNRDAV
jgi:hypothetical protein